MRDDVFTPPSVPSTARRHSAVGAAHEHRVASAFRPRSPHLTSRDSTSQHTLRETSTDDARATAPQRRRSRHPSSVEAVRQRLRSTVAIAEAEAVRAARDFSMDMYRELHQRKFASVHEELDFLRKDFVASRRTLALLHEENARLERELLSRVRQVEELQEKLEEAYRNEEEVKGGFSASSASSPRSSWQQSRALSSGGRRPSDALDAPFLRAATPEAVGQGKTEGSAHEGGSEEERVSPEGAASRPRSSSPSTRGLAQSRRTPLALYAKSTGKKTPHASAGEGDINVHELIRDLRANLARRDTSLNDAQMEMSALQNDQQRLRTELAKVKEQLLQAKQQRDKLQSDATSLEERKAAQEKEMEDYRSQVQQLEKEKKDLQLRLTTAELLYEHTGAKHEGGAGAAVQSGDASSPDHYLRDQLQLYRSKWQSAEDELDHLNERLTQLQRQLVNQAAVVDPIAIPAVRGTTIDSSAPPEAATVRPDNFLEIAAQQRAEHAAELEALRRQHQERLQLHAEEIQRLQRRLDRAQENAAFHEDQLRQQRQDDTRQHHSEVQALQTQLRTAQAELVKAQQDREHLARQLRRSTEQETTVEVLRGQVDQLKQRLGEVGAELAQVRGREKEINLNIQRERMSRAKAEHDAEVAQAALAQERRKTQYLQEEIKVLREQLGMQEASASPREYKDTPFRSATEQVAAAAGTESGMCSSPKPDVGSGDAAALASELKGYVSLMRVNTALQRRVEELEAQVDLLRSAAHAAPSPSQQVLMGKCEDCSREPPKSAPSSPKDHALTAVDVEQDVEITRLRSELEKALQVQREMRSSSVAAEKERQLLARDNAALASGVELLEKQLRKAQAALLVEIAHSRHNRDASAQPQRRRRHSKQRVAEAERKKRRKSPQEHVEALASSRIGESRLRQRLKTAQAQDQIVLNEELQKGASSSAAAHPLGEPKPATCSADHVHDCHVCCCARPNCPSTSPQRHHEDNHHHRHRDVASPPPSSPPSSATIAVPSANCLRCYVVECVRSADGAPTTASPALRPADPPSAALPAPQDTKAAAKAEAATPPPLSQAAVAGSATPRRRDASASPLHSPRRRIHGSVLPPVHYPSLVLKSRA